jgi:hypothetical protein
MATGFRAKADGRTENVVRDISDALWRADGNGALTEAVRSLRSEAAKVRRHRPADAVIIDAQLAGLIAGLAGVLHNYDPQRRDGGTGFPEPGYLNEEFAACLRNALQQAGDLPGEVGHA